MYELMNTKCVEIILVFFFTEDTIRMWYSKLLLYIVVAILHDNIVLILK